MSMSSTPKDKNGKTPRTDPNSWEPQPGAPLRKVVKSKPFPPKEEEEDPTEDALPDR